MAGHLAGVSLFAREPLIDSTDRSEQARDAAAQMESHFIRHMLAEMRVEPQGLFGGGIGGKVFNEMLEEALADEMAAAGGIGLAQAFEADLMGADPAGTVALPPMGRIVRGAYGDGASALSVLPVDGRHTSGFGRRANPLGEGHGYHTGLDIAAPTGTPVQASGGGRVVRAGEAGGYGNMVVVDHGGGLETRYAHLSEIHVQEGDIVDPGAIVGAVGSTGRSTGPHLHFEVRRDGTAVDPRDELGGLKKFGNRPSE